MKAGDINVLERTMAGTGMYLKTDIYSNCENLFGLCFMMEITSYSSGGSLHYVPQSIRKTDYAAIKSGTLSNILKRNMRHLERKGHPGPLSPEFCWSRHESYNPFYQPNSFSIKIYSFFIHITILLILNLIFLNGKWHPHSISVSIQLLCSSCVMTLSFTSPCLLLMLTFLVYLLITIMLFDSLCFTMLNKLRPFSTVSWAIFFTSCVKSLVSAPILV